MFTFDGIRFWKKQRPTETFEFTIEATSENLGWSKRLSHHYNLPLTVEELDIIKNSTVVDSDIKDLQFRLKRKLRYSELQILKLTSDHGIMIRDDDFQSY